MFFKVQEILLLLLLTTTPLPPMKAIGVNNGALYERYSTVLSECLYDQDFEFLKGKA